MTRSRPPQSAPPLLWDGHTLHGAPGARSAEVWVPARFAAFRRETLPSASLEAQKAALRLRADRLFAPLGPVAVDALIHAPKNGTKDAAKDGACTALLAALPKPALEAILKAAAARNLTVRAVRVAELAQAVPTGGLVTVQAGAATEASLLQVESGKVVGVTALGDTGDAAFAGKLQRERLRLGMGEDAPGCPAPAAQPDFLQPGLSAAEPLWERRGVRLGILAGAACLTLLLTLALVALWTAHARSEAKAEWKALEPQAKILEDRRADMKNLAPWFEERPDMAPCLHALATALPPLGASDKVRLVRLRQAPGETAVAEGSAGDRAQMLDFLGRLRQDPRVAAAEVRSFRSPSPESSEVVFELALRVNAAAAKTVAKTAAKAETKTETKTPTQPEQGGNHESP